MSSTQEVQKKLGVVLWKLPSELVWIVLIFCDYQSLFNLSSTNKTYYKAIIKKNIVFRMKFRYMFPEQFDHYNSIIKKNRLSKLKIYKYHKLLKKEIFKRRNLEIICNKSKSGHVEYSGFFDISKICGFSEVLNVNRISDLVITSTSIICLLHTGLIVEIDTNMFNTPPETYFEKRRLFDMVNNESERSIFRQMFISKNEKYLVVKTISALGGMYRFKKSSSKNEFIDKAERIDLSTISCCSPQNNQILFCQNDNQTILDVEFKPIFSIPIVEGFDTTKKVTSFYISVDLDRNEKKVYVLQTFSLSIIDPIKKQLIKKVSLGGNDQERLNYEGTYGLNIPFADITFHCLPTNFLNTFRFPNKKPSLFFFFIGSFVMKYGERYGEEEEEKELYVMPSNVTYKIGINGEKGYDFGVIQMECNSSFEINNFYVNIPCGGTYSLCKYKFGKFVATNFGFRVSIFNLEQKLDLNQNKK